MKCSPSILAYKGKLSLVASIASIILTTQLGFAASGDKVHAFFADEHNTTATSNTGNRILEIDIDNMTLVNTLDVPGNLGHHADNGFNSKLYGVPKGSNFVNVIELRKDTNGTTSMNLTKQIDLIHTPRSGDAYNKKFNVILMVARNRPMGSFINVETDEVVGIIGENVDCTLTDGTQLLSHADANTAAGALKYQCARPSNSHGGDQISGHPYWLTADYAAIVDRANKQISVYHVQQVGSTLVSTLVNHLPTRSSIHQIIPRDRTNLPLAQQADFYATEEGEHVGNMNSNGRGVTDADYNIGVAHSLIHMKLTTNGLELVKRMDLQRTTPLSKVKSDRILDACISIYRSTFRKSISIGGPNPNRESRYAALFQREGIARSSAQDPSNDFPVDCFYPGIPGGHNADFAPNNRHVYVGMAGGSISIIDVNRWKIANNVDIGIRSGPGHTCFSETNNIAITTNHGVSFARTIMDINSERPHGKYWLNLPFTRAGLINTYQSHTCYVDDKEEFYYNFFTDGGVYYKMNLAEVAANTQNGATLIADSLVTGGIPIQGSYIYVKNIKDLVSTPVFAANNDTATSDGSAVTIDVLQNDTGNTIILEHADGANYGNVVIANGQVTYTPNTGYSGTDGFWYGISSPGLAWEWAYVSVVVTSTVPPVVLVANDDTAETTPGGSVTIDVLANDTGTSLVLTVVDTAWIGTVTRSGNSIVYQADPSFVGTADIWYSVVDSVGNEEWARAVVTIKKSSGTVFKANNDTATVRQGDSVSVNVIANDVGNGLVLTVVDTAWIGTTARSGNSIIYTAEPNSAGNFADIWYEVTDASGNEAWAQLIVTITN